MDCKRSTGFVAITVDRPLDYAGFVVLFAGCRVFFATQRFRQQEIATVTHSIMEERWFFG